MKRRILSVLLVLTMVVGMVPLLPLQVDAAEATSGTCGDNLTWNLDENGTLTISGSGKMKDYRYSPLSAYYDNPAPWYSQRDSIKNVFISHGVTQIGDHAFYSCSSLTSINIPSSVTSIVDYAFSGCSSLTSINIPSSVTSIGYYAFSGCSSLASINIPSSVTSIGRYAFSRCSSLTSINIPSSVTSIEPGTFYGCSSLTSISIPNSVTSIGGEAFKGCSSLASINIPSSVTSIGRYAFEGCSSLASINIPSSVTSIGDYAFYRCSSLTSINIPSSVTSIGDYAFSYCSSLTSINIPSSVTSIGDYAFSDCSSLTSITIPSSVTLIGGGAFSYCSSLTSINIPSSVTSIGDYAFSDCSSLTSINIPSSVTSIGDYAFSDCSSLTSINIPSSVTSIGDYAFTWCSSLTSINIPSSVTSIKNHAFEKCYKLLSAFFDGNAPSVSPLKLSSGDYNSYSSFPSDITLYYIPGKSGWTSPTWQGYKTATWSGFLPSSITPMDFGDIVINASGRGYAHFKVTDENSEALAGARFQCTLSSSNGSTERELVSDGNGILSVETPTVNSDQEFSVSFQPIENSINNGLEQTIKVKVKQLSYQQKWGGNTAVGANAGFSFGADAEVGVADVEATLLKAVLGKERSMGSSISESFEDGKRGLEIEYEKDDLINAGLKSGIDASLCSKVNLTLVGASAGAKAGISDTIGLKLENYDPKNNPGQMLDVGKLMLQMILLGDNNSLFVNEALRVLNVNAANQYSSSGKIAVTGNLSAFEATIGDEKSPIAEATVAEVTGNSVFSFINSVDTLKNERTFTRSAVYDIGAGFGSSLKISGDTANTGNYALGASLSNHKELSATTDLSDHSVKELGYKTYDGAETSLSFMKTSRDTYSTVTYEGDALQSLLNNNPSLSSYSSGNFLSTGIQDAIDIMQNSKQLAHVKETEKIKHGTNVTVPFGFSCGPSISVKIALSGEGSYSYNKSNSVIYNGTIYPTSVTDKSVENTIAYKQKDLEEILVEPVKAAWNSVKEKLSAVWGSVKDGVSNACATVKSKASDFYVGITSMFSQKNRSIQSYAILSLEDEGAPDSDAALSVTLGDPYLVEVYTDESQETLVTDEQLAASPLTLTLEYTDEMLKAAGATAETEVKIYHYDAERNVYVCLPESKQDREAKNVTAQITQQGEYILAVDTAAPCVSDFKPSDGTAKPTLTALVSDLSGLKDFSFWIDDNQNSPLVTKENLKNYYVEKTGVFTYTMTEDLAVGEHTAYFMAEDTLGNRLTEPVSFTFTVQDFSVVLPAPAVPSETVRDGCFTVTTPAPKDGSVEGMTLVLETEDGRLVSIPMTLENDTWTAEVTDLSGSGTLKVYTIAADAYGNTVESTKQEVKVEEDEEEVTVTSLALGDLLSLDGKAGVKVNVTNGEEGAISALLNVAFYDEKGKQLDVVQTGVGLTGHETQTYTVGSSVSSNQVAKIKAFLLDCADGYTPLCTPVEK